MSPALTLLPMSRRATTLNKFKVKCFSPNLYLSTASESLASAIFSVRESASEQPILASVSKSMICSSVSATITSTPPVVHTAALGNFVPHAVLVTTCVMCAATNTTGFPDTLFNLIVFIFYEFLSNKANSIAKYISLVVA